MVTHHLAKVGHAGPIPVRRFLDWRFVSHKFGPLAQLVEQQTLNLWVKGSIPLRLMIFCGGSVVVTHHLAKVGHAGPIPVRRFC